MTISISLAPEQVSRLEYLAKRNGKDPSELAREVVAAYLEGAGPRGEKTFEEILSPIWDGWRKSGLTDDEIDQLLVRELEASRRERREAKGSV